MRPWILLSLVALGCSGDFSAEADEDLSSSTTYSCHLWNHKTDALDVRISKTKTKVLGVDDSEFTSDLAVGSSFALVASYVPHSKEFAGRSKYAWSQSNTSLIMEQSLRTGGTTGYLTIEGGHVTRTRVDLVCRR
jgi:hypothetical protein